MASDQRRRADSAASSVGPANSAHGHGHAARPPQTPEPRDSHDLSLSPRDVTRDSLVANMLLSLDQFSLDQHHQSQYQDYPNFDDSPPAAASFRHHRQPLDDGAHHGHHPGFPPWPTLPAHSSRSSTPSPPDHVRHDNLQHNHHHHHRFHRPSPSYSSGFDTVDGSSKFSSPPDSRGNPAAAPDAHDPVPDTHALTRAATDANANANADLNSSPSQGNTLNNAGNSSAREKQSLQPPITPPKRGASLSQPRQRRPPTRSRHDADTTVSYHQFLADTASSPASHGQSKAGPSAKSDTHRRRRSKSLAAASSSTSIGARSRNHAPEPPIPSAVIDYDVDYLNRDYDAAPTPTVPAGPRRRRSAAGDAPPLPPDPVTPPPVDRKRSLTRRSLSLRSSSGKSRQAAAATLRMHQQQQQQQQQQPPPMPTDELDSAPAPSVGYGKARDQQRATTPHAAFPNGQYSQNQQNQLPTKEKPGFFRRVFGGGGSSKNMLAPEQIPRPPSSPSRSERPPSGKLTKDQSRTASSVPPSRDTSSSHSHHQPAPPMPPLQKKTSSFFRRRKKSVVDEAPPLPADIPPVPNVSVAALASEGNSKSTDPSPVSSLRQALDPYLRNSAGSAKAITPGHPTALADITNQVADADDDEPRPEFQRGFSPDYEPSPNAKIRSVATDAENSRDGLAMNLPASASLPSPSKKKATASQTFLDLDLASDDEAPKHTGSAKSDRFVDASEALHVSQKDTSKDDTIRASKMPHRLGQSSPATSRSRSRSNLRLPSDGKRSQSAGSMSTETDYKSAPSAPPSVRVEDLDEPTSKTMGTLDAMQAKGLDEPLFVVGEPTEDDRLKAKKIFDGLEDFIQKDKAAAWMGEEGPIRKRTLQAYMELYNFTDKSILSGLRSICERLILRAETQQVDRILVAFSKRWCDCNPNHGFKATDVIHTICYSIMLLNTDLHLADIEQKMTRSQFVKNTLSTIRQTALESKPDAFQRPSILPDKSPMLSTDQGNDADRSSFRNSFRPPPRPDTQADTEDSGPLVRNAFSGSLRAWEEQIEQVLKTIYSSIRDDRLPLFGAEERSIGTTQSQNNLSVVGMLKRTPSVLSKAPSEGQTSSRGRIADGARSSASRWTSKSRSRPGMGRNGMASSRTSFDDDNSLWSPAMSSATWSRYSLGRTQASMSQDSFASSMPRGDYQQSIGFANALSQSIIRDEDIHGNETAPSIISSDFTSTQLLEDESLELAGPPWIKEGMVVHKHHLDGLGKRAKDRNWSEVFAVVQKGQLSLFSFNLNKSSRQKSRPRTAGRVTAPVGGGNWQDNAVNVGTFNLRLTLASALPSPGYSRTRPYVWALSLPTGAVHLFQVGTPEIIREFVNSANYWSARLSTHPLVGGISNIEYGWSEAIVNNALVAAINESTTSVATQNQNGSGHARKSSTQSASMRSMSFDHGSGGFTSGRGKLPGDRVHIAPWAPPTQSVRPSNLSEPEQLEALVAYVKSIEGDLQAHNQLRSPMLLAFTPRGQNAAKAMANWERKSSYLLREIVKFRTYVDCLNQAEGRKVEVYKERDLARRAARGELSDAESELGEEGNDTLRPE